MLDFMKMVAREAGRSAMLYFEQLRPNEIRAKATPKDLVSAADVAVEQVIIGRIRERYPDHDIFGEESGRSVTGAEYCWIIDPIDGTQSFIKQHPYFSISIALYRNNEPLAGVVYAPALGYLFAAEAGKGAVLNDEPIHVSGCSALGDAACVTGFGCVRAGWKVNNLKYFCEIVPRIRDIKRCGSAALDLAMVGAGRYDAYWEMGLAPYDIAAGALIATEAGAVLCDLKGGKDYPSQGVIAANPELMAQLLPFFDDLPVLGC